MTTTLQYNGDAPFHEEQVTGSKCVWVHGQIMDVSTATAAILNTTGLFSVVTYPATFAQGAKADTALQPVVAGVGIGGGGFAKHALIAGAAAGAHTVTGIKVGDELNEVMYFVGAGVAVTDVADLTAEFVVTADTITNTAGTDTTGGKLAVRWTKLTA